MKVYKDVGIFNGVVVQDSLTGDAWYQTRDGGGDPNSWVTVEPEHSFHPENEGFTGELVLDSESEPKPKPEPEPIFEPLPTPGVGDYIEVKTMSGRVIIGTVVEVGDSNPAYDLIWLNISEGSVRTAFINKRADVASYHSDVTAWEHAKPPFEPLAPGTYLPADTDFDGYARVLFRSGDVEWCSRYVDGEDGIVLEHQAEMSDDYWESSADVYPKALVDLMFEGATK